MAIQMSARIHASEAVPPVPEAYLMIRRIDCDRLQGTLTLHLAVFASAADRDKARTAFFDTRRAQADAAAAFAEHSKAPDELSRQIAAGKHAEAEIRFQVAKTALDQSQMLAPFGMLMAVPVPPEDMAACCDDAGNVTIDRCYAWLSAQPAYAGVQV